MPKSDIKKVVLAYSGGLDTSVIVPWLKENYGCEVVCFTANVGQGEETRRAGGQGPGQRRQPARSSTICAKNSSTEYLFPTLRAGAVYERKYLLGTSMARPLIAKRQVEDRRTKWRRRGGPWRHRQGQRPGAFRADLHGARPTPAR